MATISEALAIAVQHHQAGRLQAAEPIYRQILAIEPNQADAIHLLGVLAHQTGKHEVAVQYIRRAIELQGNVAVFHNNLGGAYHALRRTSEAIASYRRALELKPDYAEAHNNLGIALQHQGKLAEAIACYRRALELKPDFAAAHNNLGSDLEEIGDLQGAEDCFRAALRHDFRFAIAHYKLAELLRGKLPQQDLAAQRRLLEQSPAAGEQRELADRERFLLHFGLAKVLDARGEYAEAASHLERGNALQLSWWRTRGEEYDPQEHELFVTRMIDVCTPDFFRRTGGFGLESELPVFVVGLPRSGTTLVEQILASHSQVFGAGEIQLAHDTMLALGGETLGELGVDSIESLRRLDRETAQCLASRHLERLCGLSRTALRIVDKMMENYLYLGLLAILFSRAKFIHCRRDLRDVAVSCWMTTFGAVRWANDQQHIASRFHQYQRLMEHWRRVLPVHVLEVDYQETVADLEGVARRLVAWCGLEWEPKCLEFHRTKRPVNTASVVQVRQPVYKTSVGRWKHYEGVLASLFARLETGGSG